MQPGSLEGHRGIDAKPRMVKHSVIVWRMQQKLPQLIDGAPMDSCGLLYATKCMQLLIVVS